jgi:hypothetical protein
VGLRDRVQFGEGERIAHGGRFRLERVDDK